MCFVHSCKGSVSGGSTQASADIQRAPQLVLEEDDEDEPAASNVVAKPGLSAATGGSGEAGSSNSAEGDERNRVTEAEEVEEDGDGMEVDGDIGDGGSEGDDHTDQSGLLMT